MRILAVYSEHYTLPEFEFGQTNNHITHVRSTLANLAPKVSELAPDIILLIGYEQNDDLINQLQLLGETNKNIEVIPHCINPKPDFLLRAMQTGVREVLTDAHPENFNALIERVRQRMATNLNLDSVIGAKKIGFMSAKGGEGGSLTAANFATALASNSELKVLAIDLSLPFGDLEMYLTNQKSLYDLSDFANEIERLDTALFDLMVHKLSPNFHLISSPKSFEKVLHIAPHHIEKIVQIAGKLYDFIIFDVGAKIEPISVQVLDRLDQLCIVTTLTIPSMRRTNQLLHLWESLGYSVTRVSVILNRYQDKDDLTIADLEKAAGKKVSRVLPDEARGVQESLLNGSALINLNPKLKYSCAIMNWAAEFSGKPTQKERQSLWNRLRRK